jgi:beta-glucosidase/6-phospho-beta-glucosidase/beta-galactosidase
MAEFLFATGIECSCPTIENRTWRMDELDATEHYRYWRRDLELVRELGLKYLRYGPPIHLIMFAPGKYDWSFLDEVTHEMRRLGIVPIMDLCHFGVPDWIGSFQNPEFPARFAEYARAFAARYPWIKYYTPVNEIYVTAKMSALDGAWNEQLRSEHAFVTAVRHLVKGAILASRAIMRVHPTAVFISSESSEFYQACCPDPKIVRIADFENQRRFIALDLLYGVPVRPDIYEYLLANGMTENEYGWFESQHIAERSIMGLDYYQTNEKLITLNGTPAMLGELFGWYVIVYQYYQRYNRPVMHTETNIGDAEEAPDWLWRQWYNVQLIRQNGVPVVGFTWYSLQDQVDWNIGLTQSQGNVNPVGLFDLNRDPRPVALAYKHLIEMYRDSADVDDRQAAVLIECE